MHIISSIDDFYMQLSLSLEDKIENTKKVMELVFSFNPKS